MILVTLSQCFIALSQFLQRYFWQLALGTHTYNPPGGKLHHRRKCHLQRFHKTRQMALPIGQNKQSQLPLVSLPPPTPTILLNTTYEKHKHCCHVNSDHHMGESVGGRGGGGCPHAESLPPQTQSSQSSNGFLAHIHS